MKPIYFTVGPSQIYPGVESCLVKAVEDGVLSMSHRGEEFKSLYGEVEALLKDLLGVPADYQLFFAGSATEWMERSIENCSAEKTFHLISGSFGNKFFEIACQLGRKPERLTAPEGSGVKAEDIAVPAGCELVCATQSETSTGTSLQQAGLEKIKKSAPNALVAVDMVSSIPSMEMDFSLADIAFFSVQKGLGLPAGMGAALVSPRAMEKAEALKKNGKIIGSYHSLDSFRQYSQKHETPETPNVLAVYLLREVLKMMQEKGLAQIRRECREKASELYGFLDSQTAFEPLVKDTEARCPTVAVIKTPNYSGEVIEKLKEHGFVVGEGYGHMKNTHIRVANFPAHKPEQMSALIAALKNI